MLKPNKLATEDYNDHSSYFLMEGRAISLACVIGVIVQSLLSATFIWHENHLLPLYSALSVVIWPLAAYFNRMQQQRMAVLVAAVHTLCWISIVTVNLGTQYGVQILLWPLVCVVAISPQISIRLAVMFASVCLCLFISSYIFIAPLSRFTFFTDYALLFLSICVLLAGIPLVIAMMTMNKVFLRQKVQLENIANFDELTGLHNRHFFYAFIDIQQAVCRRKGTGFCLALGDIDHFKQVNDDLGHDIGDKILVSVADYLKTSLPEQANVCRWGGEEFIIFLPTQDLGLAYEKIDKLRSGIAAQNMDIGRTVTMSFGLVEVSGFDDIDRAIKQADELLYQAKSDGRNVTKVA